MPVLKDLRKTIELNLPKTGGKVWVYDYMIAADSIEIDKIYVTDTSVSVTAVTGDAKPVSIHATKYYEAQDATLQAMVAKWDFTDEEGKPTEPTIENIKKLPKQDFEYLVADVEKRVANKILTKDQKKK